MKKLYFVVTEEAIEGSGKESPLEALVEYIKMSDVTAERIDEIIMGHSEIVQITQFSKEELAAMPEV